MSANDTSFNNIFWSAVKSGPGGMDKIGNLGTSFIQQRLRDTAVGRLILKPQPISQEQCVPSLVNESLTYIEEIEPDSIATTVNYRSEPTRTWFKGIRMAITFMMISSPEYEKNEEELRSYKMPLTRIIEQNTVKDVQEREDKYFFDKVHGSIFLATRARYNQLVANGEVAGTANFGTEDELYNYLFNKNKGVGPWAPIAAPNRAGAYHTNVVLSDEVSFTKIITMLATKLVLNREIRPRVLVMHEETFADSIGWTLNDAGLEVMDTIVKDGYTWRKVAGLQIITTIRARPDIIPPGVVYVFPDPEFMGRFLQLSPLKFEINKFMRTFTMTCWQEIGIGFSNVRGLGAIVLDGATIPLRVKLMTPGGAPVPGKEGVLRIINNNMAAAIPTVEVGI